MTAHELHALLQSARPLRLIHVLPAEIFAATRIPGSQNACVYELTFLDQLKTHVPDPSVPLVVYGAGEGSLDAATAAEKLRATGLYPRVQTFEGGLAAWQTAGLPLEGTGQLPSPPIPDGPFRLDPAQSVIRWTGRNLFNYHSGTVQLASGEIHLRQGALISARFTIDMTSIGNEDLADPGYKALLLAHLRTADFFDVEHHPTAQFVAAAAEPLAGCTAGTSNYLLRGAFTLRGISHPLAFPVLIAPSADGRSLTGGSGKLYRFLGQHLVNDCIHLHVKIHADWQSVRNVADASLSHADDRT